MSTRDVRVELEPDGTTPPFPVKPGNEYRVTVVHANIARTGSASMYFPVDSPVLAPVRPEHTPFAPLAGAVSELRDRGGRLVVLGHASPTGSDPHNDALSLARARTVAAWLRRDEAQWVDTVTEHGSPADAQRWLRHWSRTLGWDTDPGRVDGVIDAATERAVTTFQREFAQRFDASISVDGRITRTTLAALFAVSMREFETHLRAASVDPESEIELAEEDVLGCGTSFAEEEGLVRRFGDLPGQQQRCDVVVVPPTCRWTREHGPAALFLYTRQDIVPEFGASPIARRLEIRLRNTHGRPVGGVNYALDVGGVVRSGRTDTDGRLIEDDVPEVRLRLTLETGEVVVFDDVYATAARHRELDVARAIDEDIDVVPFPDEPLPALVEDDEEDDEDVIVFEDGEDDA